jgi:hypothetical protein
MGRTATPNASAHCQTGAPRRPGIKRRGSDATLLLVYNAHHDVVNFVLPEVTDSRSWLGLIDTSQLHAAMTEFDFRQRLRRHRALATSARTCQ